MRRGGRLAKLCIQFDPTVAISEENFFKGGHFSIAQGENEKLVRHSRKLNSLEVYINRNR